PPIAKSNVRSDRHLPASPHPPFARASVDDQSLSVEEQAFRNSSSSQFIHHGAFGLRFLHTFLSPGFQVSRFPGFQVSRFPGFQVSRFPGFNVESQYSESEAYVLNNSRARRRSGSLSSRGVLGDS